MVIVILCCPALSSALVSHSDRKRQSRLQIYSFVLDKSLLAHVCQTLKYVNTACLSKAFWNMNYGASLNNKIDILQQWHLVQGTQQGSFYITFLPTTLLMQGYLLHVQHFYNYKLFRMWPRFEDALEVTH
jgi:hypothetical protein